MTLKQKRAFKEIVENHRSVSSAMREVGYKATTATVPKNLTESKGWKELLNKYLPDDKLLQKHNQALEAKKWNDFTGEREEDHTIRLRAVELGYKLKGRLNGTGINIIGDKVIAILGGTSNVHKDNGDGQDIEVVQKT